MTIVSVSANAQWTQLAPIPVPEGYSAANTLVYGGGDYIYGTVGYVWLGGGNARISPEMYRYSISANTWTRLADAPAPMEHNVGLSIRDGSIYMNRGNWTNEFFQYDIASNTWHQRGWGPGSYDAGATDGTDLYYTGGMWDQGLYMMQTGFYWWQQIANNPEPMADNSMTYENGKLYVTAGKVDGRDQSGHIYSYDLNTNRWRRLSNIPVATHVHQLLNVGNHKLLLNPGQDSSDPLGLYQYDIPSDSWTRIDETPSVFHSNAAIYDGTRFSYWLEAGTTAFYRYNAVPEPTTIGILAVGLLALIKKRRRV